MQREAAWTFCLILLAMPVVFYTTGCSKQEVEEAPVEIFPPVFESPELAAGRAVFMENCARCHETGREDSPVVGDGAAWAERIAKGEDELIKRAIEGFETPIGDEMPARGGNEDLSDEDVRLAVRYIIKAGS